MSADPTLIECLPCDDDNAELVEVNAPVWTTDLCGEHSTARLDGQAFSTVTR